MITTVYGTTIKSQEVNTMKLTVGELLRMGRRRSGMTVEGVSAFLAENGITAAPKTIYNWEINNANPSLHTFFILCERYGIKNATKALNHGIIPQELPLSFSMPEYTKEELDEIAEYAEFLKSKRNK